MTATTITPAELWKLCDAGTLHRHHSALARGYVSRKSEGYAVPYKGRFGEGYALYTTNYRSTQCHPSRRRWE